MSIIQILSKEDQNIFEFPPKLNLHSQNHFFRLTRGLSEMIFEIKSDSNKILFILMFGYFKATNKFFEIQKEDESVTILS